MELMSGIEPPASSLPRRCSTSEPHQLVVSNKIYYTTEPMACKPFFTFLLFLFFFFFFRIPACQGLILEIGQCPFLFMTYFLDLYIFN